MMEFIVCCQFGTCQQVLETICANSIEEAEERAVEDFGWRFAVPRPTDTHRLIYCRACKHYPRQD